MLPSLYLLRRRDEVVRWKHPEGRTSGVERANSFHPARHQEVKSEQGRRGRWESDVYISFPGSPISRALRPEGLFSGLNFTRNTPRRLSLTPIKRVVYNSFVPRNVKTRSLWHALHHHSHGPRTSPCFRAGRVSNNRHPHGSIWVQSKSSRAIPDG